MRRHLSLKTPSSSFLAFIVIISFVIVLGFLSFSPAKSMYDASSSSEQQTVQAATAWEVSTSTGDGGATKFAMHKGGAAVSYKDVIQSLANQDLHLIHTLTHTIVSHATAQNWQAVFWECKPVKPEEFSLASHEFEFVVLNAPSLASKQADVYSFREHFDKPEHLNKLAIAFSNLGKDAFLSVPTPQRTDMQIYTHLLSFLRGASEQQVIALWSTVGQVFLSRIEEASYPLWLSTSGLGVYWLHVRNDKVPKYYNYIPFKSFYR